MVILRLKTERKKCFRHTSGMALVMEMPGCPSKTVVHKYLDYFKWPKLLNRHSWSRQDNNEFGGPIFPLVPLEALVICGF